MDHRVPEVLDTYHQLIRDERSMPREMPASGRDGGEDRRLRAVGPDTGRLLNVLSGSLKAPTILEIGTSFGYSGIWLAEGARSSGGRVITMEVHGYKSEFARDMAEKAGLAELIDFRVGDAVEMIGDLPGGIDLVLLDLWKDLYAPCLHAFLPKLSNGAIVVADNVGPGQENTQAYVEAVSAVPAMASVTLPVGQGVEISRYRLA